MFETLNGAGPEMDRSPDSSSLSEYPEESAGEEFDAPESVEPSEPGFDNPEFDAQVANGVEDGEEDADFEASVPRSAGQLNDEAEEIPFHNHPRWKELMGQKRALEDELKGFASFAPVVERLRALGISNAEQFEAAYAAEEQRQFEANLAQAINAGVRNGTIAPADAQAHFDAAVGYRQEFEIDQQIQAAKQRFPEMDDEMVREVGLANYGRPDFDIESVAQRSHERNMAYLERHLAQYEADRAHEPPAPISNERGTLPAGSGRQAARRSWEDLLGMNRFVKT